MNTYFGLLAEFGTAHIPLDLVATRYLGMTPEKARRAAALRQLPLLTIRAGSQKSPWLVPAEDLARHLDELKEKARQETFGAAPAQGEAARTSSKRPRTHAA